MQRLIGPDPGRGKAAKDAKGMIFNFGFLIFPAFPGRGYAKIPHAKAAKGAKVGRGIQGGGMSGYRVLFFKIQKYFSKL